MKKEKKFFVSRGRKVVATAIIATAIAIFGAHAFTVHQEVKKIKADGGYYAVGEKVNGFGLPEVIKKPLE
jgi:hypothetical protein